MPGPTVEMDPVEPQSIKKLSFKSLKRDLDVFSPIHGHYAPPDPERSMSSMEELRGTWSQPSQQGNTSQQNQGQQADRSRRIYKSTKWFWDWKSGHNFQQAQTIVQPGSLDSEAGIYAACYDLTGTRLVTCEADKTIKMWREDENATPETHPLHFKPPKEIRRF